MKTRCMIIDDEPLAIQLIEKHLSQLETFAVLATANNAIKALEILKSKDIDLLFCDIKMPMLTGLDLLKTLKNPPYTILTTAHREFALESYDLDVVDYLLKPITFERFFKAIERYLRLAKPLNQATLSSPTTSSIQLPFKSNGKVHQIRLADILYLESQKDYVKVVLANKTIVSKHKISDLERELAELGFLRIHRSFLVQVENVTAYSATQVELGGKVLPIGGQYRVMVSRRLESR
jgi:two-component system, LytTR family, response regulator